VIIIPLEHTINCAKYLLQNGSLLILIECYIYLVRSRREK